MTKSGHLLGWLLRVLQQEDASDAGVLDDALQAVLRYLDTLPAAESVQHKNAILFLYYSLDSLIALEIMKSWQCSPVRTSEQVLESLSNDSFLLFVCKKVKVVQTTV